MRLLKRSSLSMILFYRERGSGDFLAIDTATNRYYVDTFGEDHFEARATAIERQVGSIWLHMHLWGESRVSEDPLPKSGPKGCPERLAAGNRILRQSHILLAPGVTT